MEIPNLSYQIIPNLFFISSVVALMLMIVRRLPESLMEEKKSSDYQSAEKLLHKGLPIIAISKTKTFVKLGGKKLWDFMLEAKDLKHASVAGYKIKKIFAGRQNAGFQPSPIMQIVEEDKSEEELLQIIKNEPRNLSHYDSLGRYYISQEVFEDARDIYTYLVNHDPANGEYYAKLAYSHYKLKNFSGASEHYRKSLALDSTQPIRYYNLGLSLDAQGSFDQAVQAFKQAILLEDDNKKFYTALSKTYTKMGASVKAKEALQKAAMINS